MNADIRSPEAYFNELYLSIQKVSKCVINFNNYIRSEQKIDDLSKADVFADSYSIDFNDSLSYILNTLGLIDDHYLYTYEYNAVEKRIFDLTLVLKELNQGKSLYISRIKNATTFVPAAALHSWVEAFGKMQADAEKVEENYNAIGFKRDVS